MAKATAAIKIVFFILRSPSVILGCRAGCPGWTGAARRVSGACGPFYRIAGSRRASFVISLDELRPAAPAVPDLLHIETEGLVGISANTGAPKKTRSQTGTQTRRCSLMKTKSYDGWVM
jgi:hypothetical protein